jgi:hypothetical protein
MRSRTLLEHWVTVRPRFDRVRTFVGTSQHLHSLILLLWPIVVLIVAILAIRKASTVRDLAELISALASLAWPVIIIAAIYWFRPELRAFLSRLRKGKFLGTEFELDELQAKAEAAEAKAELPPISGSLSATMGDFHFDATATVGPDLAQDAIEEVLREAGRSPRLGLMLLSSKIERAARERAADAGLDVSRRPLPLNAMIRALVQAQQIPFEAAEALNLFNQVRNRIVHGHDADDDEIARAIDSGTRLLRLLLSIRRPTPEAAPPADDPP